MSSSVKQAAEEDCMIAADLTLYGNPLRHLTQNKPKEDEVIVNKAKPNQTAHLKSDIVAADLVKYGSPLDDRLLVQKSTNPEKNP